MKQTQLSNISLVVSLLSNVSSFITPTQLLHPKPIIIPNDIQNNNIRTQIKYPQRRLYKGTKLNVVLTGKISSVLTKLAQARTKRRQIRKALEENVQYLDLLPILILGYILKPLNQYLYTNFCPKVLKKDYKKSVVCFVTNLLSQIGRIALIVYLFDILDVVLTVIGFEVARKYEFSTIVVSSN